MHVRSSVDEETRTTYEPPRITDVGSVEELTHGSREQTSDEPNSGYQGG